MGAILVTAAIAAIAIAACDGPPAKAPDRPPSAPACPDGTAPSVTGACEPAPATGGPPYGARRDADAGTDAAPAKVAAPKLPPPRPTTISLARTGDAALDALLAKGDRAFEASDLAAAEAAYAEARKLAPKRAAPLVGLARIKMSKEAPSFGFAAGEKRPGMLAVVKELQRAAALEPGFGAAQLELGRALLVVGDAAKAEAALEKGLRLLPDEPEAHSALGVAQLALGKTDAALTSLTKAKDLDPGSAERRGNLGTVLFLKGRVPEAIEEYEVQVRLAPDEARAHSDLGTARLAQSDFARAVPELETAVRLDPNRATFRSNLGYALQLQGKTREAIAAYREAIRLDPKLSSAWINLATALARDPKTRGEARQALKTAERLDPSDPRVKANLEELDALERGGPAKPR